MQFTFAKNHWILPMHSNVTSKCVGFTLAGPPSICMKFGNCITYEVLHTCMPKYWKKIIQDCDGHQIWNMKYCSNVISCYHNWIVWPKSTKVMNLRWRRPPFWIPFIAYNLVASARTCTRFPMRAKFDVLHVVIPYNRTRMKFNMATATILYFNTKHNKSAADWKGS